MKITLLLNLLLLFPVASAYAADAGPDQVTFCRYTVDASGNDIPEENDDQSRYSVQQIQAIEQKLVTLKYNPGAVDGKVDAQLECALTAFQKMNGLVRSGLIDPNVIKAMDNPVYPVHSKNHDGIHVEADLVRQVLTVYRDDEILRILPISSGADIPFKEPDGTYGSAKTPLGNFNFFSHIWGIHEGHLGDLFNPVYFDENGYAVHGDTEVPVYNASHGCLRITIIDSRWFEKNVPLGTPLLVSESALPSSRAK